MQFSKIIIFSFCVQFLISSQKTFAQAEDSIALQTITDTTIAAHKKTTKAELKKYIVPAVLFTYGLVTPSIKGLNKLDLDIKKSTLDANAYKKTKIDNYTQYAPMASVYALNLMGYKGKNNLRDATVILLTSKIISTAGAKSIKYLSKRLRPDSSSNNSFPSGHTTEAFANATFLFEEYKHKNIWIGIAGYAVAAASGYLRIYNNKHWLSDVVAGAGLGIASTEFAYWLYPKFSKRLFKSKANSTVLLPNYGNGVFSMNYVRWF